MIKQTRARTYIQRAYCNECKGVELEALPVTAYPCISPRKYTHVCPICGSIELLDNIYPRVIYETEGKLYTHEVRSMRKSEV